MTGIRNDFRNNNGRIKLLYDSLKYPEHMEI